MIFFYFSLFSLYVEYLIWYYVCVIWSFCGGFWKIYKDGRFLDFDRGFSFGKVILGINYGFVISYNNL